MTTCPGQDCRHRIDARWLHLRQELCGVERGRVRRCRECRRQLDAQRRHVAMFAAVKALAEERHHSLPPAADPRAASPDAVPQLPPAGLTPK